MSYTNVFLDEESRSIINHAKKGEKNLSITEFIRRSIRFYHDHHKSEGIQETGATTEDPVNGRPTTDEHTLDPSPSTSEVQVPPDPFSTASQPTYPSITSNIVWNERTQHYESQNPVTLPVTEEKGDQKAISDEEIKDVAKNGWTPELLTRLWGKKWW